MSVKFIAIKFNGELYGLPACVASHKLCRLLGEMFLTPEQLKGLEKQGYEIKTIFTGDWI